MYLENLSLSHFKNYDECNLNFSKQINCILGPNGSGKTNLLDAIHYLSLTKSAFNAVDQQNIQHGEDFFAIRGVFQHNNKAMQILCSLKSGSRKILKKDKNPYERISQHIGLIPTVLISPYDTDLLREGSSVRRKFMDSLIAQIDANYLQNLLKYQRLLLQRNQTLKDFAVRQHFDPHLLASYDEPMLGMGKKIAQDRSEFMEEFLPLFRSHYKSLSDDMEQVDISYRSDLMNRGFREKFLSNHQRDLALQRTELGIHKDDLLCSIEGYSVRKFGSQGQQKCFAVALKLAQFELLHHHKGFKPILLLDDIFDKLDDIRIRKLMEMVSGHTFGQIFITDARPERTGRILESIDADTHEILVENGVASTNRKNEI